MQPIVFPQGVSALCLRICIVRANLFGFASVHLSRKRFSVGDLPPHLENSFEYVKASQSLPVSSFRGLKTSLNGIALEISSQARPSTNPWLFQVSRRFSPAHASVWLLDSLTDTMLAAQTYCCIACGKLYVKSALELWDAAFGGIEDAFGGKGGKICCLTVSGTVWSV